MRARNSARRATKSSASGCEGQRLWSATRSPASFMRNQCGALANSARGNSQDMACASYSTSMPMRLSCENSRRVSGNSRWYSARSKLAQASCPPTGCRPSTLSPAAFRRSGQVASNSSGWMMMPRRSRMGKPSFSTIRARSGAAARLRKTARWPRNPR